MKCLEDSRGHRSERFPVCSLTPLALQFATCIAIAVFFGSFLFSKYALSSRSVRSGRARSEIFRENIDYLHLIIFVRDAGQDVLILSRVTCLSLSGFARDC